MRQRKFLIILIFTIVFSFMFSYSSKAEEPVISNVSADKLPERIDENTLKYPISYKDKNIDIIINVQDGGLDRVEIDTETHADKIMYKYNKSEGGNATNGQDGVNAFGNLEVDLEYLYSDWDTLVKTYAGSYGTQPEYISIGGRKAAAFRQVIYDDEYNSGDSDISSYSRNTSYDKAWLIDLPELTIYNTEGFADGVCVVVYARYNSKVIAKGNDIPGYTSLYESYMAEYEEALKSIISSIKIQVDTSQLDNTEKESIESSEEKDEELIITKVSGLNNGVKIVIGIAVAGIGVIIGALATGKLHIKSPIKGPTGISDGTEKVLKGKTDGREYHIKYNAEKDEWTNTETGNIFIPERFEGWQEDLAKDWEQSAKERERMSNRDTEFDREVKESIERDKENAELLKKLHHLRRSLNLQRTDAGRINRPPGEPGSMTDKINELENQLINGEAVDKELLRKVQRVYTKASNGDIAGYDDLPNNSLGKEIGDAIELTGKEIFSGSSKKALVLRGLMAIASGGATEMGMEIASAGFVIKDYVDAGGDSVVEGIILSTGNAIISEGAGRVTGKSIKFISKKGSKVVSKIAKNSDKAKEFIEKIDSARHSKFNYKNIEVEVGLNDKMIKRIVTEGGETFKNIYVAPPFQNIYKSFFVK